MEMVLKMAANNLLLRWSMHEGNTDGICLWSWLKVRYESAAKLDHLMHFYGEKIRSFNLKAGGSIGDCIDRFQGLAIIWQETDNNFEPEHRLVTQMVEKI